MADMYEPPTVQARMMPDHSWEVRCPDCGRPNPQGPVPGFTESGCHCEGMLARPVDGYTVVEPEGWPPLAVTPAGPARRCLLYRHFDEHDVLLYVGISDGPIRRSREHARDSEWVQYAHRMTGEWYSHREAAEEAERRAIQIERPVFNFAHSLLPPADLLAAYLDGRRKANG